MYLAKLFKSSAIWRQSSRVGLRIYGEEIKDPEKIASQWWDYKITPMATNLQFVFYRNKANDVLVKVLLNEDEATLPIKSDVAPYYHWNDFKEYCLKKLAGYKR